MTRRAPRSQTRARIVVNPTPAELEAIDAAAARVGVSRSQFIVGAAIDAAQPGPALVDIVRGLTPAQSEAVARMLQTFTEPQPFTGVRPPEDPGGLPPLPELIANLDITERMRRRLIQHGYTTTAAYLNCPDVQSKGPMNGHLGRGVWGVRASYRMVRALALHGIGHPIGRGPGKWVMRPDTIEYWASLDPDLADDAAVLNGAIKPPSRFQLYLHSHNGCAGLARVDD